MADILKQLHIVEMNLHKLEVMAVNGENCVCLLREINHTSTVLATIQADLAKNNLATCLSALQSLPDDKNLAEEIRKLQDLYIVISKKQ